MRNIKIILGILILGAVWSCSDWTDEETVKIEVNTPNDSPEYREYLKKLREYKQSDHYQVYVRLDNAPEVSGSERDFMRALPDSVDMIALRNSANLSQYDMEDLPLMKEKGTKVLYYVDYNAYKEGNESLESFLRTCVDNFNTYGFDGFSVAANVDLSQDLGPQHADALTIIQTLGSLAGGTKDKPLVLEGSPLFVPESSRDSFDYYILSTYIHTHYDEVEATVDHAKNYLGMANDKLMLSAGPTGVQLTGYITNKYNQLRPAVTEMAWNAMAMGPLGGMAVMNVGDDYYGAQTTYRLTRDVINILNYVN